MAGTVKLTHAVRIMALIRCRKCRAWRSEKMASCPVCDGRCAPPSFADEERRVPFHGKRDADGEQIYRSERRGRTIVGLILMLLFG